MLARQDFVCSSSSSENKKPMLTFLLNHLLVNVAVVAASLPLSLPNERIIGGITSPEGAYPSAVSLEIHLSLGRALCGGTLITNQALVTAAHCVMDITSGKPLPPRAITVRLGSQLITEQRAVQAVQIHPHPAFSELTAQNDIAVIIIPPVTVFNKSLKRADIYRGPLQTGTHLTAVGWGLTDPSGSPTTLPDALQQTNLVVGEQQGCRSIVPSYGSSNGPQICTQNSLLPGKDTCQGDSGTGVYINVNGKPQLAGLTSFGGDAMGNPTCALDNGFGIYTHISYYQSFIDQSIRRARRRARRPRHRQNESC